MLEIADNLAVLCTEAEFLTVSQNLAEQLAIKLLSQAQANYAFYLCYRDGCLNLLEYSTLTKSGLSVNIEPRAGELHSYPAAKNDLIAHAVGKKSKSIVDATTGWAQDSLALFRMGYHLQCIERSPIMAALIADGFLRLSQKSWVQNLQLSAPVLMTGNAITLLATLSEAPDCIYLDPMFPPKKKKSALAKKSIMVLRELLGDDSDRAELFAAAWQATGKRVVVKSPDYAQPMAGKPSESLQGKLHRYDVYIK